ncbi:hypothetical protein CBR_g28021 [Chara braunii]|uniref:Uncharacterized protein n=1 Tax=Chara braunii TaxID=69332 RepID=A0A388L935_CHABU|nr:hypothetical protein CBR_g28021 [Chara braunii]|eukprot:GBG78798.1 hypothetical protein CBR_g28021 [Chara braunii]
MDKCPKDFVVSIEELKRLPPCAPAFQWPELLFPEVSEPRRSLASEAGPSRGAVGAPVLAPVAGGPSAGAVPPPVLEGTAVPSAEATIPPPASLEGHRISPSVGLHPMFTTTAARASAAAGAPLAGDRGTTAAATTRWSPPRPPRSAPSLAAADLRAPQRTGAVPTSRWSSPHPPRSAAPQSHPPPHQDVQGTAAHTHPPSTQAAEGTGPPPPIPLSDSSPTPAVETAPTFAGVVAGDLDPMERLRNIPLPQAATPASLAGLFDMSASGTVARGRGTYKQQAVTSGATVMRGRKDAQALEKAWLHRLKTLDIQLSDITAFVTDSAGSPYERAWSRWSFIHSKTRKRLEVGRAEKLVRCHWNLHLLDRPSLTEDAPHDKPDQFGKWVHYWQHLEDELPTDQQLVAGSGARLAATQEEMRVARERMRSVSRMGTEHRLVQSNKRRRGRVRGRGGRGGRGGRSGRGRGGHGGRGRGSAGGICPRSAQLGLRDEAMVKLIRFPRQHWDKGDFLYHSSDSDDEDFFCTAMPRGGDDDGRPDDDRPDDDDSDDGAGDGRDPQSLRRGGGTGGRGAVAPRDAARDGGGLDVVDGGGGSGGPQAEDTGAALERTRADVAMDAEQHVGVDIVDGGGSRDGQASPPHGSRPHLLRLRHGPKRTQLIADRVRHRHGTLPPTVRPRAVESELVPVSEDSMSDGPVDERHPSPAGSMWETHPIADGAQEDARPVHGAEQDAHPLPRSPVLDGGMDAADVCMEVMEAMDLGCPPAPMTDGGAYAGGSGPPVPRLAASSFYDRGRAAPVDGGTAAGRSACGIPDVPFGTRSIVAVGGRNHGAMREYEDQHGRRLATKTSDVAFTRVVKASMSCAKSKGGRERSSQHSSHRGTAPRESVHGDTQDEEVAATHGGVPEDGQAGNGGRSRRLSHVHDNSGSAGDERRNHTEGAGRGEKRRGALTIVHDDSFDIPIGESTGADNPGDSDYRPDGSRPSRMEYGSRPARMTDGSRPARMANGSDPGGRRLRRRATLDAQGHLTPSTLRPFIPRPRVDRGEQTRTVLLAIEQVTAAVSREPIDAETAVV